MIYLPKYSLRNTTFLRCNLYKITTRIGIFNLITKLPLSLQNPFTYGFTYSYRNLLSAPLYSESLRYADSRLRRVVSQGPVVVGCGTVWVSVFKCGFNGGPMKTPQVGRPPQSRNYYPVSISIKTWPSQSAWPHTPPVTAEGLATMFSLVEKPQFSTPPPLPVKENSLFKPLFLRRGD